MRIARSRLARLSRLAGLTGVSESQIGNIEVQGVTPGRTTVVDLAAAFGDWDVDEALRLAGYEPLSDDERAVLAKAGDPKAILDRLWPELSAVRQVAIVNLVRAIVDPQSPMPNGVEGDPAVNPADLVVVQEVTPGAGTAEPPDPADLDTHTEREAT